MSRPVTHPSIAVIVPCFNEEAAVAGVVHDLRSALPQARIVVYDNASTDRTAAVAASAGAEVRREPRRGKGNVIRRAFADIDADVYVLIDGDGSYDASAAPVLVDTLLRHGLDQVIGARTPRGTEVHRRGHALGNRGFSGVATWLFRGEGEPIRDLLTGYRVLSRRFVKSFPAIAEEFEIETELTVHSMSLRLPMTEVETAFGERTAGGESKLRTFRDGLKILAYLLRLARLERPVAAHGFVAAIFSIGSLIWGIPVIVEYLETRFITRMPSAVLATGLALSAFLTLMLGFVLAGLKRARDEAARLRYLALAPPPPIDGE